MSKEAPKRHFKIYNPFLVRKYGGDSSSDDSSSDDDDVVMLMPPPPPRPSLPPVTTSRPKETKIIELSFSELNNPFDQTIDLTDENEADQLMDELEDSKSKKQPERSAEPPKTVAAITQLSNQQESAISASNNNENQQKKPGAFSINPAARLCPRYKYVEQQRQKMKDAQLPNDTNNQGKAYIPPSSPQISLSKFKTLSIEHAKLQSQLQSYKSKVQTLQEEVSLSNYGMPKPGRQAGNTRRRKRKNISDIVLESLKAPVSFKVPMRPAAAVKRQRLHPLTENVAATNNVPQKPLKRLDNVNNNNYQTGFTYLFKEADKSGSQLSHTNNSCPSSSSSSSSSGLIPLLNSQQDSGLGSSADSSSSSSFSSFTKSKPKNTSRRGVTNINPSMPQYQIPESTRLAMAVAESSQKRQEILAQKEKEGIGIHPNPSTAPKTSTTCSSIAARFRAMLSIPTIPIPFRPEPKSPKSKASSSRSHSVKTTGHNASSSANGLRKIATSTSGRQAVPSRSQTSATSSRPAVPVFNRLKNSW